MADKRANVDWNDRKAIWYRVPSAKSAVTQACTAIDKLVDRRFVYNTPAACSDACKRLIEAYDFCVELHDRWSDLETKAGTEKASKTAEESLRPYEDKQHAALSKLAEYVAANSSVAPTPRTPAAVAAEAAPKLNTCKLLFPEKIAKTNTPGEFRLWVSAFRRFYDASGLQQQPFTIQKATCSGPSISLSRRSWSARYPPVPQSSGLPGASTSSRRNSNHYTPSSTGG